ncbi:MAG: hypothetical protein NTW29_14230 [Bacteroidetes bacterium]|nr:hypothetical protein [Bacteroidota bacterium]
MSKVKTGAIWQHERVLPYILSCLKDRISNITPVKKILLFGSRGRLPIHRWQELEGKDWDIVVQAGCKLKNAQVLVDEGYHIDLLVLNEEQVEKFCYNRLVKEIYPVNEINYLLQKINQHGNNESPDRVSSAQATI